MLTVISDEIKKILRLQHLDIQLKPQWGSEHHGHQKQIHSAVKSQVIFEPRASISHAIGLGGFAWSSDIDVIIGLDVELTERVKSGVAKRVCERIEEFEQAPSPAYLWCAKESCFKALRGPNQPITINEIRIQDWNLEHPKCTTVSSNKGGLGCVFQHDVHTIAIYTIRFEIPK